MHTQESGQGMKRLKNVKMRKILAFMVSLALMVSCMPSAYTISADEILGDEMEELFSDDEDTSVWTAEEITPDVKNSEGRETEQQEEQPVENPDRQEEEKAALPEYISLLVLVRSQSTRRIWTSISVLIH